MTAVKVDDDLQMVPLRALDYLAGMYFVWDTAPPTKRDLYHGRIIAGLDGGYYLLLFAEHDALPPGVHEIVHVSIMAEQCWSFFQNADEYQDWLGKR